MRPHLAPGARVVLSGLLVRQDRMVLAAHRMQGLRLVRRHTVGEWRTLVLAR
jgi:ribosomal protein L11 methyltransferase